MRILAQPLFRLRFQRWRNCLFAIDGVHLVKSSLISAAVLAALYGLSGPAAAGVLNAQEVAFRGLQEEEPAELLMEITESGYPLVLALDRGQLDQKLVQCLRHRLPGLPPAAVFQITRVIHELTTREIKGADYVPKGLADAGCDSAQSKAFLDAIGVMTSADWVAILSKKALDVLNERNSADGVGGEGGEGGLRKPFK